MSTSLASYLAIASDYRPSSIADCYSANGELDLFKFLSYQEKCSDLARAEKNVVVASLVIPAAEEASETSETSSKRTRRRHAKALTPCYFNDDGIMVCLKPRETVWWHLYVQSPLVDNKKFNKKFRRRFRMTYEQFQTTLVKVKRSDLFARWVTGKDATGKPSSPIELMVLGAMRYLGRGLTFDDLEEYTAVSEEPHRQFFHRFID